MGRLHLRPRHAGPALCRGAGSPARAVGGASARLRGLSQLRLAYALRVDPLQLSPVLETLVGLDLIGRLEEEGASAWCCSVTLPRRRRALIGALLLERQGVREELWRRSDWARLLADLLGLEASGLHDAGPGGW